MDELEQFVTDNDMTVEYIDQERGFWVTIRKGDQSVSVHGLTHEDGLRAAIARWKFYRMDEKIAYVEQISDYYEWKHGVEASIEGLMQNVKGNKDALLDILVLAEQLDEESGHVAADQALLGYVGDEQITEAFDDIHKWYA